MPRHLVLVGLPGAGKSTIGRMVAEELGTSVMDVDAFLVRQMGMPVSQIFGKYGEAEFRSMERGAVRAALAGPPLVLVPGGGWAAQEGELEAAAASSLIVYLKCPPATAAKRVERGEVRPLLRAEDPAERMRALLAEREPYYLRAPHHVDVGQQPAQAAAAAIVAIAKRDGGW
ncbi:MAG TPA: shikimate kinase [Gemmatimonadales bacterium]|nr:shikimate kinase [Gemmatimonadales bacterium]